MGIITCRSQRLFAMMLGNLLFCRYVLLLSCVLVDGTVSHVSVEKPLSFVLLHACSTGSVGEDCIQRLCLTRRRCGVCSSMHG